MEARPARLKAGGARPRGRCGTGPVTARHRLLQVDGDVVGEQGHGEVGQFLAGLHHVQVVAKSRAGLTEDGEAVARTSTLGDVDADDAHPERLAVGALKADERGRERVFPTRARRQPRPVLVHPGDAALEHLPHHRLKRLGLGPGQYVGESAPQPPVTGNTVVALQRVVHPGAHEPEIANDDTDLRGSEKELPRRSVHRFPGQRADAGHGHQPLHPGVPSPHHRDPQTEVEHVTVAMAHRRRTRSAVAGTAQYKEGRCRGCVRSERNHP
jgi:hypothetical protein